MWKQILGNYFFQPCTNLLKIIKKKRTLQGSWQKKSHVDWIIIERVVIFWMWKENKKSETRQGESLKNMKKIMQSQKRKCYQAESNHIKLQIWRALFETPRFNKWLGEFLLASWFINKKSMQKHTGNGSTRVLGKVLERLQHVLHQKSLKNKCSWKLANYTSLNSSHFIDH